MVSWPNPVLLDKGLHRRIDNCGCVQNESRSRLEDAAVPVLRKAQVADSPFGCCLFFHLNAEAMEFTLTTDHGMASCSNDSG